jgi:hypothetical protein
MEKFPFVFRWKMDDKYMRMSGIIEKGINRKMASLGEFGVHIAQGLFLPFLFCFSLPAAGKGSCSFFHARDTNSTLLDDRLLGSIRDWIAHSVLDTHTHTSNTALRTHFKLELCNSNPV